MGGGSKKSEAQVAAYYLSQHLGFCSTLDWVSGIFYREKRIWAGRADANQTVAIDNLGLFGGHKEEGGVQGNIDIMLGGPDQAPSEFLASKLGRTVATCPGFRGITSLFFRFNPTSGRGFRWQNNNAYLGSVWLEGTRAPKGLLPEIALIPRRDSVYRLETVDLDAETNVATNNAGGLTAGVTVGGFDPDDVIKITLPAGQTFTAWSPWGTPALSGPESGSLNRFSVIPDGVAANAEAFGQTTLYDGYEAARAAFGEAFLTGGSSYTFYVIDTGPHGDNSGGLSIRLEAFSQLDANPSHIIYECHTDTNFMGAPSTLIDVASFEAAAVTLYNEGLGLSLNWSEQTEIENFVQEIVDHIEATVFTNPRTGLITIKLIRGDYDESTLRELTPDNCVVKKFQRKAWADTINEIIPTWTNPDTEEAESAPPCQDPANIAMQGGIVSASRNYYGVRSEELARTLGYRDLRVAAEPLASCDVELDRSFWDLLPGDCVKLTYPEYGINELVMRVGPVDYGKPGDSKIKASLVEDIFAKPANNFTDPNNEEWEDPDQEPEPIDFVRIFTLPYYFAERTFGSEIEGIEYPEVAMGVLAADDSGASDYELLLEAPDTLGNMAYGPVGTKNLVGRGALLDALEAEAESLVPEFSDVIGDGPEVGGFLFIGDAAEDQMEICLIDAYDTVNYTLRRGVLDTVPRAWPADTPVWLVSSDVEITEDTILSAGETVNTKLLSVTSLGQLAEADAPVETETLTGRPHLPTRPADVKVDGIGFGTVDAIGLDPIPVTWANRNRLTEPTPFLAWDDGSVTPEDGQTTTILVKDLSGTILTTHDGLPGTSYDVPAASFSGADAGIIQVLAGRDSLTSLQGHEITVTLIAALELEDTGVVELESTGVLALES